MSLVEKVNQRTARVGVLGLGYVGLPLLLEFGKYFPVYGFDTDREKVQMLNAGQSYIQHIPSSDLQALLRQDRLHACHDFSALREVDAAIICVPTPLNQHREPDLSFVINTAQAVAQHLQRGQLVVLESTTYPGTTDEVILPILESSGLQAGRDFLLAYSPERVDPGNKQFGIQNVPKVVGGINPASLEAASALYATVVEKIIPVSSTRAAEMTKLLENIYRCVNIALVNELKLLSLRMGLDIWEVIDAASTKPYGFTPFQPGPGLGGHCIPIDPFYLSWKAREFGFTTRFIELAGEVNTAMPAHAVNAIAQALSRHHVTLSGARILVLGVAYKRDVDDLRESPSLEIIELLQKQGAQVDYNDPFFEKLHPMRKHNLTLRSVSLDGRLGEYDCVVIATDHSCYEYERIVRESRLVADTRNATRHVREQREKIVLC